MDPLGINDIKRRWLPEFDKPLGTARALGRYDNVTKISMRSFASGTTVVFNHTINKGVIKWSDGTVTEGPGCPSTAKECQNCYPPYYEHGRVEDGTGGCNCGGLIPSAFGNKPCEPWQTTHSDLAKLL